MANGAERHSNNFDFIRFVAAFLVIYGHSLAMIGVPYKIMWGAPISTVGVFMFFALSGYLVTQSWERDPSLVRFFTKRGLRIFPALIVCVLITAFVLGPALTWLPTPDYFQHPTTYTYLQNIFLYTNYFLPGVFDKNTLPGAINGSLWSLPVEFFCYIAVAAIGVVTLIFSRFRKSAVLLATIAFMAVGYYLNVNYSGQQIVFYATDMRQATAVIPFFFIGSLIFLYRVHLRTDVALLAVLALFSLEGMGWGKTLVVANWILLPYATLAFGVCSTPIIRRWGNPGDFSYGMYLYSFPIQQTLVFLFRDKLTPDRLIVSSALLSIACAFASWHLIERPALRLKTRRPSNLKSAREPEGAPAIL